MKNKKPLRFKKVVDFDWSIFHLDWAPESYWDMLVLPFYAIVGIPLSLIITFVFAPIIYFLERKVYYEEERQ